MQALEFIKDLFKHEKFFELHFVTNGLCILGALMGFLDFLNQFLDEVLY